MAFPTVPVVNVSEEVLAPDLAKLAERRRADGLVFTRWALVMCRFEKAFYEDPNREDLNGLWWGLVEEVQLVNRPPDHAGEPDWAAKIHVALAPVYYHNYVLGNLTAAQLRNHLEERVAGRPFFASELAGFNLSPVAPRTVSSQLLRAPGPKTASRR